MGQDTNGKTGKREECGNAPVEHTQDRVRTCAGSARAPELRQGSCAWRMNADGTRLSRAECSPDAGASPRKWYTSAGFLTFGLVAVARSEACLHEGELEANEGGACSLPLDATVGYTSLNPNPPLRDRVRKPQRTQIFIGGVRGSPYYHLGTVDRGKRRKIGCGHNTAEVQTPSLSEGPDSMLGDVRFSAKQFEGKEEMEEGRRSKLFGFKVNGPEIQTNLSLLTLS
ncbi:hypothetical protein B0H16DRAFT_1487230 [Mycena metata]|uniref:Uncharacterized protein n=1 Tax=Mycena metata TaxID=1033252 RepID=A0AAD7DH00_9AGAR|nr:hypothetical protein B0H16DRAFT_1487230 [Mycena metata]